MKVIIFGTGGHYQRWKQFLPEDYQIIAFADNSAKKVGTIYEGVRVVSPENLPDMQFDKVIIASVYKNEMLNQLIDLGIDGDKIGILFCYPECKSNKMETYVDKVDRSIIYDLDGVKFKCRTKSDFGVVRDIYSGIYNFKTNRKFVVVIDVGMNIGLATLYFASKKEVSRVYSFEPFRQTYENAEYNINLNEEYIKDKIITYNIALGNDNADKKLLYDADHSERMSIIGDEAEAGADSETIHIKDASEILEDIIYKNKQSTIMLKMDCEGSEYAIFDSLDKSKLLDKIDIILMEWHGKQVIELEELLLRNKYEFFKTNNNDIGYIYGIRTC